MYSSYLRRDEGSLLLNGGSIIYKEFLVGVMIGVVVEKKETLNKYL